MTTQPDLARLLSIDRDHLWHPYGSALTPADPYVVESARGVRLRLRDRDGQALEVIDAMSSWWCAIHGYAVPALDAAAHGQLAAMSHVMFGGLTHQPAIELGAALVSMTPHALQHVFFADSGSVAVEVAMKMALQYQLTQEPVGAPGRAPHERAGDGGSRTRFFTIAGGYHGDTFSPMSVTDPVGGMHSLFAGVLPKHVFAPRPPPGLTLGGKDPGMAAWERDTRALYADHAHEIAAVIIEPILQGAGGMHVYSPYALGVLHGLARSHGALIIHDEIATGFHRTGPLWAADHQHPEVDGPLVPDILCLGKALTGGYLTLAATMCTREVAVGVSVGAAGGLMHGPTFMANPLACAIALASLTLVHENDAHTQVARVGRALARGLAPARELPGVRDVRTLGAVGVVELSEPVRVAEVTAAALARGVWVRPFRNLVYTMPPYVTPDADLELLTSAIVAAVAQVHGR